MGLSMSDNRKRKSGVDDHNEDSNEEESEVDEEAERMTLEHAARPHAVQTKLHWGAFFNKKKRTKITVKAVPRLRMVKVHALTDDTRDEKKKKRKNECQWQIDE